MSNLSEATVERILNGTAIVEISPWYSEDDSETKLHVVIDNESDYLLFDIYTDALNRAIEIINRYM